MPCHVVRRDSSAIKFKGPDISFSLNVFGWLKPGTMQERWRPEYQGKSPDDDFQKNSIYHSPKIQAPVTENGTRTLALATGVCQESRCVNHHTTRCPKHAVNRKKRKHKRQHRQKDSYATIKLNTGSED